MATMANPNLDKGVLDAVLRAETPAILFPEDVAVQLRLQPTQARTAMRLGLLGPWFLVNGEPAVLRENLKEHLRLRTIQDRESDREILSDDLRDRLALASPVPEASC